MNNGDCDNWIELFMPVSGVATASAAATLDSLHRQSVTAWRVTVVSNAPPEETPGHGAHVRWVVIQGEPESHLNPLMAASGARWVAWLEPGTLLQTAFVEKLVRESAGQSRRALVYTDHIDRCAGADFPCFKPQFNLELLRSVPYTGPLCVVRTAVLRELGGYRHAGALGVADLAFRVYEARGADAIGHLAGVLYIANGLRKQDAVSEQSALEQVVAEHLARSGIDADVQPGYQPKTVFVEYSHRRRPLVSIIIPTKDRPELIGPCLSTLLGNTEYPNFEVLVVDNNTTDRGAAEIIDRFRSADSRVRVLDYRSPYNFAAINNLAAREARGEYLALLNNDTMVVQPNWLDRMLSQGQRPDVGIVGARLVYPDQTLQHAGVVLGMGPNGVADHVHIGKPLSDPGYMKRAQVAQELSAVTAACLLIRKNVYTGAGGMDEKHLSVLYNDVDLCLKVREQGLRVIWTPFATLVHHCSASLGDNWQPARLQQAREEAATMLDRWLPKLARDPAYNPNLSLIRKDCSPDTEVRAHWDHVVDRPRIMATTLGSEGSRRHRVCIPIEVLRRAGRAAGCILPAYPDRVRVPSPAELAREAPDVLVAHNAVHDVQLDMLENARRFNPGVFRVFSQDDLMTDLPAYNEFRDQIYPDMRERLRRAMAACHRLVVTTEPLAQAYGGMAEDICVLPNYLDGAVWRGLVSERRRGRKPRVGWAGAQQHSGDLEVIFDVVKETAGEVEWVFFGLCFKEWLPYGVEVHDPVSFERFPEQLAGLNLDLAVAPLAYNRFNEAKSNLKILEYGALGIPVVCTDIHPYKGAPVEQVPNSRRAWLQAIRERVHDLDAAAGQGDLLQRWVLDNWLLEGHVDEWLSAWLPDAQVQAPRAAGGQP